VCSKPSWDFVCVCECRVQMGVSWHWDWYLPRTFLRSDVSGAGVFDGFFSLSLHTLLMMHGHRNLNQLKLSLLGGFSTSAAFNLRCTLYYGGPFLFMYPVRVSLNTLIGSFLEIIHKLKFERLEHNKHIRTFFSVWIIWKLYCLSRLTTLLLNQRATHFNVC